MKTCFSDPTLSDVLAHPLVRTILAADRVDTQKLETMLGRIARTIAGRSANARSATAMVCCA